ncbi:hypothetical protein OSB04_un001617 [Centaurea solstitialis]|uniref:Uncharacterized protein n=1 Tax=Centaurea solstitialis TaxID=347529 RepID=A0AA38SFL3_9ASTR|nr:hypothetical protein OSB04_un001617 [Centaurea solstitialis]
MDLVSILDQRFLMKKRIREEGGEGDRTKKKLLDAQIEEDLSFSGQGIFYDEEDELQENDSEFLQSGTVASVLTRERSSKNKAFFE